MPDGRFMYVSQYSMYGDGFYHEGTDVCSPSSGIDKSYVYRVPLDSLKIDKAIKVGAVPKFLAVTPDQKYLLVSNWCSYTLSVVDVHTSKQIESIYLGPYPRGIAVDPESRYAYVAVMGSYDIARVDLQHLRGLVDQRRGLRSAASLHGRQRQVPVRHAERRGQRGQDRPRDPHRRRQGLHRPAAAQHGHRPRRQVAVRGQLRLQHDDARCAPAT